MLDHEMLRNLRSAGTMLATARNIDVSNLTDEEEDTVNDLLTQIIGDAMRIRSRVNRE